MSEFRNILNKNIIYFIDTHGVKITHLAKEFGYRYSTISGYLNDKTVPPIDFLLKFAHKFGVTLDELTSEDLTAPDFVSETKAVYGNEARELELLNKSIELKDKEIELLKKENEIINLMYNECQKHLAINSKKLKKLENKASGLLEGKRKTK